MFNPDLVARMATLLTNQDISIINSIISSSRSKRPVVIMVRYLESVNRAWLRRLPVGVMLAMSMRLQSGVEVLMVHALSVMPAV